MGCRIGNLEMYLGPRECGGPDDLKQVIIDFVNGAVKTLEIAVQELDCMEIAHAVVRARQRGVRVQVVLEGDYLCFGTPKGEPFTPTPRGKLEPNLEIMSAMLRAGIDVKSDYNGAIFHQKFVVRDRESLLTGSTNFTDTGVGTNLNHIVVIHDRKVAGEYAREFREIRRGRFGKWSEHDTAPSTVEVSGIPVKVLFAPDHNPEMEIMKQMMRAEKSIHFAIFTFARSSGIDDTMIKLARVGVRIVGAMDGTMASQSWAPKDTVKAAGAELFTIPKGQGVRKLHHKIMVIDERIVIAGSFNYTRPATLLNDENILVMGHPEEGDAYKQYRLASEVLREIKRITDTFGKPV
ncbi:phospholipase [Pseudodesulfovibrio cashew]|uniref:phospholipase D n=1 Tax=Pseudodesulfovibrio cashew TaxID=2678688 RepID=A0A6I6J8Z9_9BACT|nr:phospholipase D-like domain-containing protein [Pseudodesulfovibrio cashew]QGY39065.1 phospholipase [Pseudodesulfovibrio cashew]